MVGGIADEIFLRRIFSFFDIKYRIKFINSKCDNEMPKKYLFIRKTDNYSSAVALHDIDGKRDFEQIKKLFDEKIEHFFVNPCIELLMVLCTRKGAPSAMRKREYAKIIEGYFDIDHYEGSEEQVIQITKSINEDEIEMLVDNLNRRVSKNIGDNPSTDFKKLIDFLQKVEEEQPSYN
jgi:hypothetical protein